MNASLVKGDIMGKLIIIALCLCLTSCADPFRCKPNVSAAINTPVGTFPID